MSSHNSLRRALQRFDIAKFAALYGGQKESPSPYTYEWLFRHADSDCGSSRLRYNSQKQTWICWGCNKTGTLVELIQAVRQVDEERALDYLLDGYVGGDSLINEPLNCELKPINGRAKIRVLPQMSWPDGVELLTSPCFAHEKAWDYLYRRGIGLDTVREYYLGYGRSGRLKDYVVFPCFMDHRLVYYQARATWDPPAKLFGEDRRRWIEQYGYRKSLNPYNDGKSAVASEVLFNYQRARECETVAIVEGPVDAVKVGYYAVGLFGKSASSIQIERLSRMSARNYVVYLDCGEEERKAAEELATRLLPYGRVYVAVPPAGCDPGALDSPTNAAVISRAEAFTSNLSIRIK